MDASSVRTRPPTLVSRAMRRILPGTVRQNAYVVPDVDRAIAQWVQAGVGPWFVLREAEQSAMYFRYREFLDAGHAGIHHVAFWVDDFDVVSSRTSTSASAARSWRSWS
jgi:hypothetical protein